MVERELARDRVFFISAKEVQLSTFTSTLLDNVFVGVTVTNERHELVITYSKCVFAIMIILPISCSLDEVMAEGYQSRFLEFQRFESKFKACLSSSAIQTKFEQHYKRADDIIQQLGLLLTEAEQECVNSWYVNILYSSFIVYICLNFFSKQLTVDLHKSKQRQQQLHDYAQQVKEDGRNVVLTMTKTVDKKVNMVLKDLSGNLSTLVDDFNGVDFDQRNLMVYQEVGTLHKFVYCFVSFLL